MEDNDKFFVDLVGQIMDGFSEFEWGGRPIYIRHHNFREQIYLGNLFEKYKDEAIKQGIPTEETSIKEAIERKDWSEKEEKAVTDAESRIKALIRAAQNIKVPSQKESQMRLVEKERKKIADKKEERKRFLIHTAESLAYQRASNVFMDDILFSDKECSKKLADFDDYSDIEYAEISKKQNEIYNIYSEENIAKAVLRPFFVPFMPFTESSMDFIGKPIIKLTVFQLKLLSASRTFFNIFKNVSDIPDMIREDPEAIIQFIEAKNEESHQPKSNQNQQNGAKTYFGANKDDIQKMKEDDQRVVSLSDEVKKHGGKMNMDQMIKMMGE